mgnify:CR=1 FL=1
MVFAQSAEDERIGKNIKKTCRRNPDKRSYAEIQHSYNKKCITEYRKDKVYRRVPAREMSEGCLVQKISCGSPFCFAL